jgi:hypothetical protein
VRDDKQATRLIALAISARERGDHFAADELMKLALEAMEGDQPVAQQQQQVQPKKED